MAAKPKTIPPVRPNLGIQAAYRSRMDALIDAMAASCEFWLRASYRKNEPEMAQDASPARVLNRTFRKLARRWQARFDEAAPELARYFATAATERANGALMGILKRAGMTVKFKMTPAMNDAYQAVVAENVGLIKSIASEYLTQVQGHVMRSVQQGRDLGGLTTALQEQFGVTKRRASLIARDQNNKATAVTNRVRQRELGITQAVWLHSAGGKKPRKSHVAQSGKPYDIATGWLDPDVGYRIWPGELISCRCVSKSIVPGLT